jgi:hypothetical protein
MSVTWQLGHKRQQVQVVVVARVLVNVMDLRFVVAADCAAMPIQVENPLPLSGRDVLAPRLVLRRAVSPLPPLLLVALEELAGSGAGL